jgi:hypothetical protein
LGILFVVSEMPEFSPYSRIDLFLRLLIINGILHLAFSTNNEKRFTVSCDTESSPPTCIVQFLNGQKTKLFYFYDGTSRNFICICPTLQNGDEEQHQRICMLDRDEVEAEMVVHSEKERLVSVWVIDNNKPQFPLNCFPTGNPFL